MDWGSTSRMNLIINRKMRSCISIIPRYRCLSWFLPRIMVSYSITILIPGTVIHALIRTWISLSCTIRMGKREVWPLLIIKIMDWRSLRNVKSPELITRPCLRTNLFRRRLILRERRLINSRKDSVSGTAWSFGKVRSNRKKVVFIILSYSMERIRKSSWIINWW